MIRQFDLSQDNVEHGYYDEDDDSDFDLDESMRHFGLMANLRDYTAGGKEWVICRMWGSGKTLKVRTLGCARSSFPPTDLRPSSLRSRGRTRRTRNTERHGIYTG